MSNVKISDYTEDTAPGLNDWIETETEAGSSKKVKRRKLNAPLGYAYSNTATGAASIASETDISGMSVTFSVPDTTVVEISFSMLLTRASNSGRCRVNINVDGSSLSLGHANGAYYSHPQGENNVHSCVGKVMTSLAAGSHTIKLRGADALTNANTDFWGRTLIVRAMG